MGVGLGIPYYGIEMQETAIPDKGLPNKIGNDSNTFPNT